MLRVLFNRESISGDFVPAAYEEYSLGRFTTAIRAGSLSEWANTECGSALLDRLEVVLLEVVGDLVAEHSSLGIGGAEVNAS